MRRPKHREDQNGREDDLDNQRGLLYGSFRALTCGVDRRGGSEPKTAAYLRKGLSEHGFVVDVTGHGTEGLHLAQTRGYDAVLLDMMLPGENGWSMTADYEVTAPLFGNLHLLMAFNSTVDIN